MNLNIIIYLINSLYIKKINFKIHNKILKLILKVSKFINYIDIYTYINFIILDSINYKYKYKTYIYKNKFYYIVTIKYL